MIPVAGAWMDGWMDGIMDEWRLGEARPWLPWLWMLHQNIHTYIHTYIHTCSHGHGCFIRTYMHTYIHMWDLWWQASKHMGLQERLIRGRGRGRGRTYEWWVVRSGLQLSGRTLLSLARPDNICRWARLGLAYRLTIGNNRTEPPNRGLTVSTVQFWFGFFLTVRFGFNTQTPRFNGFLFFYFLFVFKH